MSWAKPQGWTWLSVFEELEEIRVAGQWTAGGDNDIRGGGEKAEPDGTAGQSMESILGQRYQEVARSDFCFKKIPPPPTWETGFLNPPQPLLPPSAFTSV